MNRLRYEAFGPETRSVNRFHQNKRHFGRRAVIMPKDLFGSGFFSQRSPRRSFVARLIIWRSADEVCPHSPIVRAIRLLHSLRKQSRHPSRGERGGKGKTERAARMIRDQHTFLYECGYDSPRLPFAPANDVIRLAAR